jgi:Domain of unknown function (DUF1840)
MLYKFKSAASGDVIMLGPQGDQLLRLLGREPAAKGIIDTAAMPAALLVLEGAIRAAETAASEPEDKEAGAEPSVGLRQRLWPMVEMLRRCQAAGEPIVWGV